MSIFENSRLGGIARYDKQAAKAAGRSPGSVMTVRFELDGEEFVFGVSWQVVRNVLGRMLQDEDPAKAKRVVAALMTMKKLDVDRLRMACDGHA